MRKIIVSNLISVDGFIADPKGKIDWHQVDSEFNAYAEGLMDTMDTILFGRVTYELMVSFWPTPEARKEDPIVARGMNEAEKIVFSKTLTKSTWENTVFQSEIDPDTIKRLKAKPGKDILIFGSGTIVAALTKLGLIDEYRLIVNPVILGKGVAEFPELQGRVNLALLETRIFSSGNVMLTYAPQSAR